MTSREIWTLVYFYVVMSILSAITWKPEIVWLLQAIMGLPLIAFAGFNTNIGFVRRSGLDNYQAQMQSRIDRELGQ